MKQIANIQKEKKKAASTNGRIQDVMGSLGKTTHGLESRIEASIV